MGDQFGGSDHVIFLNAGSTEVVVWLEKPVGAIDDQDVRCTNMHEKYLR